MSFAALPWWALALAASTAVAIVVALYLLRRTPPRRVVSNVTFWARALERARPRVLRATQIPIVALLVTLLVALLLVAEIGDPRFGEGVRGTTVIVVGAGQSMSATEGGSSRLEQALREAQAWADRATSRGEAALVRAGIRPEVTR